MSDRKYQYQRKNIEKILKKNTIIYRDKKKYQYSYK